MSILFSRHCEYALQAVSYLALKPAGDLTSIRELTKRLDIPYHFLAKILQDLVSKRLLISRKGPSGGFGLAAPAAKISLSDIVEVIDGDSLMTKCVMGFPECSGKNPCAAHGRWAAIRKEIEQMLSSEHIAEVAKGMKKTEFRRRS
jgi:Rrf2 family protein